MRRGFFLLFLYIENAATSWYPQVFGICCFKIKIFTKRYPFFIDTEPLTWK